MRKTAVAALPLITAVVVAGCGGGSPKQPGGPSANTTDATKLLRETFTGSHSVKSGDIDLALQVVPSGSTSLTSPITVSFGGPFESGGSGKLPESDFTVTGSAQGQTGKLSIVSTGSAGYITVDGVSYRLPASSFKSLTSTLSGKASKSGSGILGALGIHPLSWLSSPRVVGRATVAGASTTHISASLDVPRLLKDLSTLVSKASSLGVSGTSSLAGGLSAKDQASIAAAIKSPTFDVWTGNGDQTLRKLAVGLTVPVSGKIHQELGGLASVKVTLTLQYSDINRPQTITAPTHVKPYVQFQEKLAGVLEAIGGFTGTITSGTSTVKSGSAGVQVLGSPPGAKTVQKYTNCITAAKGDVAKMQKCASLLGGG